MPVLDVVIVTHNNQTEIKECVSSLRLACIGLDYSIIVFDNDSTDDTVSILFELLGDDLVIIPNDQNIGFGPAVNRAVVNSTADVLLLLNPDCIISSTAISAAIEYLKKSDNVGACGINLLDLNGNHIECYGDFPQVVDLLSVILPLRKGSLGKTIASDQDEVPVDYVSGAAFFIKREVFENVGGFDERYFLYFEETDLCYRMSHQGLDRVVLSYVSGVHFKEASFKGNWRRKLDHFYASQQLYYNKWFSLSGLVFWSLVLIQSGTRAVFWAVLNLVKQDDAHRQRAIRNRYICLLSLRKILKWT
ncbi:MAG: glycosyltransferase family 2 protein [Candidatus Desulforudis sp.]|nr:glycosyltransferase family 2 protein [Desulforudis sp.]